MMSDLHQSWQIGAVRIPSRLVLAPMAGVSVQAYRRQARRFGAGLVWSEMISAAGLGHGSRRTRDYLRIDPDEHPIALQIFGSEPAEAAEAARTAEAAGADVVDLNLGCPVRKVMKSGAGSALLGQPELACRIVEEMAAAVSVPAPAVSRVATPPLRLTVHRSPAYENTIWVLFMAGFCSRWTVPEAADASEAAAVKKANRMGNFITNLRWTSVSGGGRGRLATTKGGGQP